MSLQVWLPLTKDLRNQGLNGIPVTSTGTISLNDSGKLGKCYKTSNTGVIDLKYAGTQINAGSISLCGWFKFNKSELAATWSGYSFDSSRPYPTGNLIGNNSYGGVGLIWYTNSLVSGATFTSLYVACSIRSTANGARITNPVTIPFDTWVHLALIFNKTTKALELWMNGELKVTSTMSDFDDAKADNLKLNYSAIWGGNGPSYSIPFYVNDVRIYDHCLSPMEIKELAKGLVLHYPLSDPSNDEKENLMPSNYWSGTKTISLSADTTNYGVINYPAISVETDTTYFWTVKFRITSGGSNLTSIGVDTNCSGGSYSGNDSAHTVITTVHPNLTQIKAGEWQTAYCITKVKADATNPTIFHTIYGRSSTATTLTVEWHNLMLVESTEVVPFRGWHSNTIYDCSGFCNNGAIVGALTISNDTPKYQVSTHIGSTSSKVHISNFPTSGFGNSYSFAWWGKRSSNGPMFWGFSDGIRLNGMYAGTLWNTGDSSNNPIYVPGTTTTITAPSVNVWHHYVMTGDGTTCKLYVDGVLYGQAKTYKAISGTSIWINGWDSSTSYCSDNTDMSDFRIYATALSASDVKSLYQNSAYIDSSGNVYGAVHTEV